jgi:glycosyltransferase involved in cell wall biosynthesis
MRVTLLGFTLPDTLFREVAQSDAVLPAQTQNFAWAMVGALRSGGAQSINLVSAAPVSSFPRNRKVIWKRSAFEERGIAGMMLPFVNLPIAKHITRFMSCWIVAAGVIRRHRSDWLVVHGVHSPFLWFAVMFRRRTSARICVVLTDPPGVVLSSDGRFTVWMKKLDIRVVTAALARFDAVISLTGPLAEDFAPGVPRMIVEGIYGDGAVGTGGRTKLDPPVVVYAGSLQEEYGVGTLVRAVTASDLDIELHVFGKGPADSLVREAAMSDQRIVGPALLSRAELQISYESATVLVQPRPINQPFVPYSFPSKLIEYMASGTPVISTRLPSVPPDYEPFVVFAATDDEVGIRDALREVLMRTEAARHALGAAAERFIRESKSEQTQGRRIVKFLKST